jgi:tetratricopeptide (TPR) repeat protein
MITCFVVACALHQTDARSQAPIERTRAEEGIIKKALTERRFAFIDQRLNDLQKLYELGQAGEDAIKDGYEAFGELDPEQQNVLREWVKTFPKSYAAHLALGRELMWSGLNARGEEFAVATAEERLQRMKSAFLEAKRELRTSISLTPKPLYSFQALMVMARSEGDREEAKRVLKEANKICPANHAVRVQYQISLWPRWGGSNEEMDSFREEAKREGLDENGLAELEAIEDWSKGKDASDRNDEVSKRRYYEAAFQHGTKGDGRFKQDYLLYVIGYLCSVTSNPLYCVDPILIDYSRRQRK